jgi:hypothetical protein
MQKIFEHLFVCNPPPRDPIPQAGQESIILKKATVGREQVVESTENDPLFIKEIRPWPQTFGAPFVAGGGDGALGSQDWIGFDGKSGENVGMTTSHVFLESCGSSFSLRVISALLLPVGALGRLLKKAFQLLHAPLVGHLAATTEAPYEVESCYF